jgi:hypothetical protein
MFASSLKLLFECSLDGCSWPKAVVGTSTTGPYLAKATLPQPLSILTSDIEFQKISDVNLFVSTIKLILLTGIANTLGQYITGPRKGSGVFLDEVGSRAIDATIKFRADLASQLGNSLSWTEPTRWSVGVVREALRLFIFLKNSR